jgi:hypothetical protein
MRDYRDMWWPTRSPSLAIRPLGATVLLFATGGLLAACGTGGPTGDTIPRASPTTAAEVATGASRASSLPSGLHQPVTKQEALAFANGVNLTLADVPGFTVAAPEHEKETAAEKRLEHDLLRCAGPGSSSRGIATASSKEFKHEQDSQLESVSSEVSIARTSAVASKELGEIRSGRTRACLSHYLDLLFKGKSYQGLTVEPFSIASGTPPAPGANGSFGWRVTTAVVGHGLKIRIFIDILGFLYGRAEVTLLTSSVTAPFPAAAEQRLFALLLERAKALTTGSRGPAAPTHSV